MRASATDPAPASLWITLGRVGPVWYAVFGLYVLSGLLSPGMFRVAQISNTLQVAAFLGVVAVGQTLALLVGGIDLSVAGVVTLTNIVTTTLMASGGNAVTALAVSLGLAAGVGLVNGALVAFLEVPALVATLATNAVLFGGALVYTGGAPHGSVGPDFARLGQGHFGPFPISAIFWLGLAAVVAFIIRGSVFGRQLYAVGANPVAARILGVPVRRVTAVAYVGCSALAACGGALLTAYIGAPSLGIGDQFLLTSVSAAVVGGTALSGGVGGVAGTVGGTLFITELNSFTNVVRVPTGAQFILQGVVIAASVLLYRPFRRQASVVPPVSINPTPQTHV